MQSCQRSKSIKRGEKKLVLTLQLENNGLGWPYESLVCTNRNAPCNLRLPELKQYRPLTKKKKEKKKGVLPACRTAVAFQRSIYQAGELEVEAIQPL